MYLLNILFICVRDYMAFIARQFDYDDELLNKTDLYSSAEKLTF